MKPYEIKLTRKDDIRAGDAIEINGEAKTVSIPDVKNSGFMGVTIFGDSYKLGLQLVRKCHYPCK